MSEVLIRHGACGKGWTGVTRGHCAGCHETFTAGAFDRHQTIQDGKVMCHDPVTRGLVAHPQSWGRLWGFEGRYWTPDTRKRVEALRSRRRT